MYMVWVEVEAIHNRGVTEWRKQGTGLPGTEAEAGLHYRVCVGQCSGGNTKMGMNSTDIFYNWSKSILCGIKSEYMWGVRPHGMRRIGISGSTMSVDRVGVDRSGSEWIGVDWVHQLTLDGGGVVGYR
jgi:hypothetical protein